MEDTLRGLMKNGAKVVKNCLNPCFNGRYSQSYTTSERYAEEIES